MVRGEEVAEVEEATEETGGRERVGERAVRNQVEKVESSVKA